MPNYKRNYTPGGTYFFTTNLYNRRNHLLTENIDALRSAVKATLQDHPFNINAWVVLPEHMHCIWTLPKGDDDFSIRWRAIKTKFTMLIRASHNKTYPLWQRGFWEHTIQSEADYRAHLDYVHINPLKHGWVTRVADWPYSSFHRYVAQGVYTENWAGGLEENIRHNAGEQVGNNITITSKHNKPQ